MRGRCEALRPVILPTRTLRWSVKQSLSSTASPLVLRRGAEWRTDRAGAPFGRWMVVW